MPLVRSGLVLWWGGRAGSGLRLSGLCCRSIVYRGIVCCWGRSGCWGGRWSCCGLPVGESLVDRGDLKGNLVTRAQQGLVGGMHLDDLIGPGIVPEVLAQRHGTL